LFPESIPGAIFHDGPFIEDRLSADTFQQRVNSRLLFCHTCRNRRVERDPRFFSAAVVVID